MKTRSLLTVILLLASLTGFAQKSLFDKLADAEDISHITVTKSLLKMMPGIVASVNVDGIDVNKLITKLEQIDIFTSENSSTKQLIKKAANELFKSDKSYEILMKVKDKGDDVVFYGQKEGNFFKSLVMFVDNDKESVLIRLLGKFTLEDIQELKKED